MENKVKNVLSGIGFYGTLAVCLLVVGVCGWVLLQDREDPLPQQAVTPQVPVSQPVEMPEVRLPTVETLDRRRCRSRQRKPRSCRRWRWITRLWRRKHPVWWWPRSEGMC